MFYKSIAKVHRKWSKVDVYKNAFDEITSKNPILQNFNSDDPNNNALELLIDSSLIVNKCGVEGIGYGGESKKKLFTHHE